MAVLAIATTPGSIIYIIHVHIYYTNISIVAVRVCMGVWVGGVTSNTKQYKLSTIYY